MRIGKKGSPFWLYKFRTLREGFDRTHTFASENAYLPFGKFLRRTHLDELPQIWNLLKGDLALFGWRPEEERNFNILPYSSRNVLIQTKPGLIDLATVHFFDEEEVLKEARDKNLVFWQQIRPMKFILQAFYIQNKSFLLNLAILWAVFKKVIRSLFQ